MESLKRQVGKCQAGLRSSFGDRLARIVRDERGNIVILASFMFPVLIGGMGLGAETGFWYLTERKLQHAADVAAHAGGIRNLAGDEDATLTTVATHIAEESGFDITIGAITVNHPPASGAYAGDDTAVEVILQETYPRLFSSLFGSGDIVISTRAVVAGGYGGPACILALHGTASDAFEATGNTTVNLLGCEVAANSTAPDAARVAGSAAVTADCINTVGGNDFSTQPTLACGSNGRTGIDPVVDPYAVAAQTKPNVANCHGSTTVGANNTEVTLSGDYMTNGMNAICYDGDLTFRGTVNIASNTIVILNGAEVKLNSNALVQGTKVMFYLTNGGNFWINGDADLKISAPTYFDHPTWYGMAIWADNPVGSSVQHKILGGSNTEIKGAVYTPEDDTQFQGNANLPYDGCLQVIGDTIEMTGNSKIGSDCLDSDIRATHVQGDEVALVE